MIAKVAWGLTTCLLWPLLIVCSANTEIVRGQSPTDDAAPRPMPIQPLGAVYPPGYHVRGVRRANLLPHGRSFPVRQAGALFHHGSEGRQHHGHHRGPVAYGEPYPETNCQNEQCGRCRRCRHGGGYKPGFHPTHRHFSTYDPPNNLVYPPAQVPAAVVQYPYYTTKGPSDFFMK